MPHPPYRPGQSYRYPLILKKLLGTPLIYSPDREIVYRDQTRYTYRVLYERIHRLAGALAAVNVAPSDTVAVMDYDSHRYLECFFAIPMMGAVLQTVNWRLSRDQIVYCLRHAEAKHLIVHRDFLPLIESVSDRLEGVRTVVAIAEGEASLPPSPPLDGEYEELLAQADASRPFPDLDEDTRATTFYTTGTTGQPKAVYYSHRQLMLHTLSIAIATGCFHGIGSFRSNDVYMPLTPMFHVHAWGYPYVATLLGAKQVYPGKYEPDRLLRLIQGEGVTFSHCVPTILQMILTAPAAKNVDLSHWKVVTGGAQLPRGLARAAMDRGVEIHGGYGLSETGPVMTLASPKEHMLDWDEERKLDVITRTGKPVPLVELEAADASDRALPHDGASTGEVIMRAPWLTESYFKDPERTETLWRNGWLHSGDVGTIDEEGYLQITDRIKDVIKSGGEWISSLELENLMSQHEGVLESAAVAVPDEKWGERPLMVVALKPELRGKLSAENLKGFMKRFGESGRLPDYAVPDRYELVEALPKTSVGKIDKKALRKRYGGGGLPGGPE